MEPDPRHNLVEQSFPARLDQLSVIGEFITAATSHMDMTSRDLFAVQMAVDEAATNIILHGYAGQAEESLHISCWQQGDDFFVQMRDRGQPFDASDVPEPDLHSPLEERREGGLGVYLIRRMMDRVEFSRQGDENVLTMVRHCTPSAGLVAGTVVVMPKGRIDATTSSDLEGTLREELKTGGRFVVVDLSHVSYISSGGLRALLVVGKELRQQGGNLMLCCAQPGVTRVLRITGFAEILPLHKTREAALEALEVSGEARPQG